MKRRDAGEYAVARTKAEHALMLREAEFGSSHSQVADSLDLLGDLHRLQGDLVKAEPLLQRSRALREQLLGKSHPNLATSLHHLATLYLDQGLYGRAEPLFLRALALREAALGKSHPDVASSLQGLADVYSARGLYDQAEPLYDRALDLREVALGDSHPDVATSLHALAALYRAQGRYGEAESHYEGALLVREAVLGKSHPDVATSLHGLAALHSAQGRYGEAEPLVQRALALREVALGNNHPQFAFSLHGLAALYNAQGRYGEAEPLVQRALKIQEAVLGEKHPDVATSLHDLATLYSVQGMYDQAEPHLQRALKLREAALGDSHPDVAISLQALGTLYLGQGMYDQAEPLLKRALKIQEAALGDSHPDVATSLHALATLYLGQGLYDRVEPLLKRALKIQEDALGKSHPDFATSLHDFATLHANQGQYDIARPLYELALSLREAPSGGSQLHVATSLHALATLYVNQGLYDQAEPLLLRALAIREETLGHHHPDVATSLDALARLRLAQNRLADALPLYTRAFSISEQRLRQEALDFSESRLARFLHQLRASEEAIYALLRAHPEDARVRHLALSAVLLLKGRSVEETAHISRTLNQSLSAEDRDTLDKLRNLRAQLTSRSLVGPGTLTPAAYQQQLKTLTEEGDALEAELAKRSAPLRSLTALPPPSQIVERVAGSLPKDGALVEFIAYEDSPLVLPSGTPQVKSASQLRYLALVLFPDASTQAVDLGPAESIDKKASSLRDDLARHNPAFQSSAFELYKSAFHPLLPLLGSTRRILLSPEGQLGLVPFAALHDGKDILLDSFDFTYLTSGRELLPRPQESAPSSFVFVLADPDFSAPAAVAPSRAPPSPPPSDALGRFFYASRSLLRGSNFSALPGTRLEAEGIQHQLPQAQLFLGPEATKERLLHLPTPGILHLATHGFFLGSALSGSDSRGAVAPLALPVSLPSPQQLPLLNSGIVLGRPLAADSGDAAPRSDTILVTALELAGLDLWGTQLVVLSACDTGRGEVLLGQGIYGLRRALVVAGAETVVMSLWSVNDGATRLLMDAYYRNLLQGQGRASALREAMRSLRASHPHPFYWAPFIALGSDAPLRAITPSEQSKPTP
ncbi:tetratricopeptide repeat protein [Cystobacter fuscus]|nr:tetratricopeptide repeat protein [Cystobacter fuscus]